jgi:nucleoid-associated protein YgaU
MRKDVKIIMGVCVVVLVGLIVYALFLPGEKKGVATNENGTENTTANNEQNAAPTTEPSVAEESTTQPSSVAVAPTTQPGETATPAPIAAAPTSGDWNKLLNTGTTDTSNTASSTAGGGTSVPLSSTSTSAIPSLANNNAPSMGGDSSAGSLMNPGTSTGQRTYTIKSGDTPSSIALAEYGNRTLYTKILAANPKLNARHMHVGQKITLPDLSASSKQTRSEVSNGNTTGSETSLMPAQATENTATANTSSSSAHYTVASGDSLQKISIKLYGNSSQWQKIYTLNKSKIGSNPAHIHIGEVLQLPKAPTAPAQSAAAAQ